jgi:hypothetical protein
MNVQARRLFGTMVLALVAGVVLVSAAYAEPEYQAGQHLRTQQVSPPTDSPDAFERAVARATDVTHGQVATPGGASAIETPTTTTDEGFRWGDALLGAGSALGLVLLGCVGVLTVRQRDRAIPH